MKKDYPRLGETVFWETLENGLTVAVVPRPGFSKKLCYFVTDYGAIHTQFMLDGKTVTAPAGIAHYLEHKMFDMPEGEISSRFASIGADVNAFTSYDMTAYYFSCTDRFSEALRLLLSFVSTPYFTEESVRKEQGIIGQEIEMNADTPETVVFERLMACMYKNHPINTPILGTRESISQITPEILTKCHQAFYTPENMLLCVVGDVEEEQVCATESSDRVYFWKLVESSASTGEEISSLIMKTIDEIEEYGVNIVSYATDNCPTMKATEKLLRMSGRCLKRVPCGAHILNGVFKDFINSRGIKPIWDNVGFLR